MKKLTSLALCGAFSLLLSACTDAPPTTQVPRLSFDQYKPIMLNVAKIEIVDKFHAGSDAKHVELMMKQPPEVAVQDLLKKVLVAGGPSGVMRVIIDDASVVGEKLQVTNGMMGIFTDEPAERYHATVELRFELVESDAPDIVKQHANVHADRTKTVMKDSSPADRDMAFFSLDDELMGDVSHELQTQIRTTFGLN